MFVRKCSGLSSRIQKKCPTIAPRLRDCGAFMGLLKHGDIKAVKPTGQQQTLKDGQGLQLRISHGGNSYTWFYQYRHPTTGQKHRIEYGSYPQLSIADARLVHLETKGLLKQGIDPLEQREQQRLESEHRRLELEREKARQQNTIEVLCWRWFNNYAMRNRRRPEYAKRIIEVDILPKLGKVALSEAHRAQLICVIDDVVARGSPGLAREVLLILKQIFAYGEQVGAVEQSPIASIKASTLIGRRRARDRYLTLDEVRAVWLALPELGLSEQTVLAIKLLLVTGQRRGELISAKWEHIDWETLIWTIPISKNGKSNKVPLSPLAERLFRELHLLAMGSPWCFPGKNDEHLTEKSVTRAIARKQGCFLVNGNSIPHWTPHDLRRTATTQMQALGVLPHVIELTLNHTIQTGVSSVFEDYALYQYLPEIRQGLNLWAERIESLIAGDKVVPMAKAKRR